MVSPFRPIELVNTQEIPVGDVEHVSIEYISERIAVYQAPGDVLVLKEYLNASDPELLARISVEGGHVSIRHGERSPMYNFLRGHIELYVPKSYFGAFSAKSVSGSIVAEGRYVLSEVTLTSTSGRVAVDDITAGTAAFFTISGGIDVGRLEAVADAHTTSGGIRIGHAAGSGRFRTVSGGVTLAYRAVTGDIRAESTSGGVRVSVPASLSFSVDARSVSGKVDIAFPGSLSGGKHDRRGTVGPSPAAHLTLRTVSGRVEVTPEA